MRLLAHISRSKLLLAAFLTTAAALQATAAVVKVNPSDNRRKAYPLQQGCGSVSMSLTCDAPWRIKTSTIIGRDSESLWKRLSSTEYRLSNAYAPQEYVMIKGVFVKPGKGKARTLPQFRLTSPAIDLQWEQSCGDAADETKEDSVPAALLLSSDSSKHRYLVVKRAKDRDASVGGKVILSWTNPQCVRVWRKLQNGQESQISSGYKFTSLASERLRVEPVSISPSTIKFTAKGEKDDYAKEQVEDSVYAFTYDLYPTNIKFNYDTSSTASDGINLRKNYSTDYNISNGEWTKQGGAVAPVCYRKGQSVKIKVKFGTTSSLLTSAKIRAENADVAGEKCLKSFGEKSVAFLGRTTDYIEFAMSGTMLQKMFLSNSETLKWIVSEINAHAMSEVPFYETGPHKVYVILDNPIAPWSNSGLNNQNAWSDALDFTMPIVRGVVNETRALSLLTDELFSGMDFIYDTMDGRPWYVSLRTAPFYNDSTFRLSSYMQSSSSVVNCYDQACGVAAIGRLIGISNANIVFAKPFGYINKLNLIGVGPCNNPFFNSPGVPAVKICGEDDCSRSYFACHMFVNHGGHVYDACVGPIENMLQSQYLATAIDKSTEDERQESLYLPSGVIKNGAIRLVLDNFTLK